MIDNNIFIVFAIMIVLFLIYNLNKSKLSTIQNNIQSSINNFSTKENFDYNDIDNNQQNEYQQNEYQPNEYQHNAYQQNETEHFENQVSMNDNNTPLAPLIKNSSVLSTDPSIYIPNKEINSTSNLNSLYEYNLKGDQNIVSSINPDQTKIQQTADFGEGYNLGVDLTDNQFKKYMVQAPPEKPKIISDDLLPKQNEDWFETPLIGTKVDDANLLADAIFKVGVDTVGQTRKNPAYDIRGTIANPKFAVSPWNNSSWEPDNNLKPLCS